MIASCLGTSSLRNTFIEELGFVEGRRDTGKLGSNINCYPSSIYIYVMWVKQCHKSPIWEWFIPPMYGDLGDGLWHLFTYNYSNMEPFLALPISTG